MKTIRLGFFCLLLAFAAGAWAEMIDINTATAEQFATLKDIGKVKAEAIVKDREKNGPFKSVDDLARVKGIKAATIKKNLGSLSAGAAAPPEAAIPPAQPGGATGAAVAVPAKAVPK
ncbi:ComEA family DNA-binding protein [Methyloterricola oryzae]|uniref:ComEA family DNA-binding protein n=1 Tax=Methyloterricola oryzae TaxID=1495050 RepID=UPI0005EB458A|nr:ComEA family DNA-binding protein [Methyloterricola oryzae]